MGSHYIHTSFLSLGKLQISLGTTRDLQSNFRPTDNRNQAKGSGHSSAAVELCRGDTTSHE